MHDTISISFKDINPYVRGAYCRQFSPGPDIGPKMVYDHQLFYIHKGLGKYNIDGAEYNAAPGDLFFLSPAVASTTIIDKDDPFFVSYIGFDFTKDYEAEAFISYPYEIREFRRELATKKVEFKDFCGFIPRINLAFDPRIGELMLEIAKEYQRGKIYGYTCVNGMFAMLISMIARHTIMKDKGIASNNNVINQLLQFIHDNYDKALSYEEISNQFHFHPHYLNRLIVAQTGMSLHKYITGLRMKKAIDLILNSDMGISEISQKVGYNDIHYFSKQFKIKTGLSPAETRRRSE